MKTVVINAFNAQKALKYLRKFQDKKIPQVEVGVDLESGKLTLKVESLAFLKLNQVVVSIPASLGIDIRSKEDFSFTVDLPTLLEAVLSFGKDEAIDIIYDDGTSLEIKSFTSGSSLTLPILFEDGGTIEKPFDFDAVPVTVIELSTESLYNAISSSAFAASNDEAKMILLGINFSPKGEAVEVRAVDGHRMVVSLIESCACNGNDGFTLPAKTLSAISGEIKPKKNEDLSLVSVSKLKGEWVDIGFASNSMVYYHRIKELPGTPPNYNQLIPDNFLHSFTIPTKELLKAVEGAAKVAAKSISQAVKFNFDGEGLEIEASDGAGNSFNRYLNVGSNQEGKPYKITFNFNYVVDGLKKTPLRDGSEVILLANGPTQPAVFRYDVEEKNFTYLVMPIQIRE